MPSPIRDFAAEEAAERGERLGKQIPDITRDGRDLILQWRAAGKRVYRAKSEVDRAVCDFMNDTAALVKWMAPDDAAVGEKIAIWHIDELIQVEITGVHPLRGTVTIRKRGREAELRA